MSYHHWSKGLEPGEEPHHGYGGLQRQIRMALLDHSKHYDVTQRLANIGMHLGQPGIAGVPVNRWPLIHNLHVGTQGIERGSLGHRSESAHALSGRFAPIPINLDASSKEIAGQIVEQTAAEEVWNKSRGQLNTNLYRNLTGLTDDQKSQAVTELQNPKHVKSLEALTEWNNLNAIMTGAKLPELKPQEKVKLPETTSTGKAETPAKLKTSKKVEYNPNDRPVTPNIRMDIPVMSSKQQQTSDTLKIGYAMSQILPKLLEGGKAAWAFGSALTGLGGAR